MSSSKRSTTADARASRRSPPRRQIKMTEKKLQSVLEEQARQQHIAQRAQQRRLRERQAAEEARDFYGDDPESEDLEYTMPPKSGTGQITIRTDPPLPQTPRRTSHHQEQYSEQENTPPHHSQSAKRPKKVLIERSATDRIPPIDFNTPSHGINYTSPYHVLEEHRSPHENDRSNQAYSDEDIPPVRPPLRLSRYNRTVQRVRSPTPVSHDELEDCNHEASGSCHIPRAPSSPRRQQRHTPNTDEEPVSSVEHHRYPESLDGDNLEQAENRVPARRRRRTTENGSGSRGRLTLKDFALLEATVLKDAIGHYRCQICTLNPFPNDVEEQQMAIDAWRKACDAKKVTLQCTEEIIAVITRRASQVRGELKQKARPIIEALFGLTTPSTDDRTGLNRIRERVELLRTRAGFAYENPDTRSGAYEHPFIQKVLNEVWFRDATDEGVVYADYFTPRIPLVTIALILTVAENVFDEWRDGERFAAEFTEKAYGKYYRAHLEALVRFRDKTHEFQAMPIIQARLLRRAREHARVARDPNSVPPVISDSDLDVAVQEWAARRANGEEVC